MKKKFLSVVLSVAMAATLLVGCGSTGDSSSDTQTQQQKRVQTQQQKEQMHRQKKVPILQTTKLLW